MSQTPISEQEKKQIFDRISLFIQNYDGKPKFLHIFNDIYDAFKNLSGEQIQQIISEYEISKNYSFDYDTTILTQQAPSQEGAKRRKRKTKKSKKSKRKTKKNKFRK
jgi:hypothetical protein